MEPENDYWMKLSDARAQAMLVLTLDENEIATVLMDALRDGTITSRGRLPKRPSAIEVTIYPPQTYDIIPSEYWHCIADSGVSWGDSKCTFVLLFSGYASEFVATVTDIQVYTPFFEKWLEERRASLEPSATSSIGKRAPPGNDYPNTKTGLPGKPTAGEVILMIFEQRRAAGEVCDKVSDEAKAIALLVDEALRPGDARPKATTVENHIRKQFNRYKATKYNSGAPP